MVRLHVKATGRRYFTNSVPQRYDLVEVEGLEGASFTAWNFKRKSRVITNAGTTIINKRNKIRNIVIGKSIMACHIQYVVQYFFLLSF